MVLSAATARIVRETTGRKGSFRTGGPDEKLDEHSEEQPRNYGERHVELNVEANIIDTLRERRFRRGEQHQIAETQLKSIAASCGILLRVMLVPPFVSALA